MRQIGPLFLVLLAVQSVASSGPTPTGLQQSYEAGGSFAEFLASVEKREDQWNDHYRNGVVPEELVRRARAAGHFRMLVVTEDWCGDSAYTIPYVAKLVGEVEGLSMRLIGKEQGTLVMRTRLTPDYRAATPTIVLLDETGQDVGCWVERPAELQDWFQANKTELEHDDLYGQKYEWYEKDAGLSTLREIVELLEAAAAGQPIRCTK